MCFSVKIERNFNILSNLTGYPIDNGYLEKVTKLAKANPKAFKLPDADDRIYPSTFSPIVVKTSRGPLITAMRYRLTPSFSEEVDYKSTDRKTGRKKTLPTYNARLDSLTTRQAWKNIYQSNHAFVPVKAFYEFVERDQKSVQVEFKDDNFDIIWASALWDKWESPELEIPIYSFAIVTTEPPKEILSAGHDRCPIFHKSVEKWDSFFETEEFLFKFQYV